MNILCLSKVGWSCKFEQVKKIPTGYDVNVLGIIKKLAHSYSDCLVRKRLPGPLLPKLHILHKYTWGKN